MITSKYVKQADQFYSNPDRHKQMYLPLVIKESVKFGVKYCLLPADFGLDKLEDLNSKSHQTAPVYLTAKMQILVTCNQLLPIHLLTYHP